MDKTNHPAGKILILSGVRGDTRRYRCLHLYEQLSFLNTEVELSHITHPKIARQVADADTVIFHRTAYDKFVGSLIKKIEKRNGIIISDIDDYIFNPKAFNWIDSPEFSNPIRAKLYIEEMKRFRTMLEISQGIITSTDYLAEVIQHEIGKTAWVHRNAFSLQLQDISEKAYLHKIPNKEKIVIGYASGTPTHNKDFSLIKPYLKEILNHYPQVEIHLVGSILPGNDWGNHLSRIKKFPFVKWQILPSVLAQFDINLAPLIRNNPFNQSKSEIKYIEAGLVKVPTIASSTDSFNYAIQSGDNGILINSEDEWLSNLEWLIENQDERRQMGEKAYQHVINKYHPFYRAQELVDILDQATSNSSHPHSTGTLRIRENFVSEFPDSKSEILYVDVLEKYPNIIRMGLYTLKNRGVKQIIQQSMLFIMRLASSLKQEILLKLSNFGHGKQNKIG